MGNFLSRLFFITAFATFGYAQMLPFGFWKQQTAAPSGFFPTHSCASISGTQTFSSNTTIDDTAITTHKCKDWVVNTGVTLTFSTMTEAPIGSLTLNGTAQVTSSNCTTSACYQVKIYAKNDVNITTSAKIQVDGKGYLGGRSGSNSSNTARTLGNVTTGGAVASSYAAGGAYGGAAGKGNNNEAPNLPYGSIENPTHPGSGGAAQSSSYAGGNGGGVIRLLVAGTLTIDGQISSKGTAGASNSAGNGSGGSIWITASTITTGSSGLRVVASGLSHSSNSYGSGSGGRIAIEYNTLTTFVINSTFVQAYGAGSSSGVSSPGTIYAKTTDSVLGDLYIYGTTNSAYMNSPLGVFAYVSSVSSTTLTGTTFTTNVEANALAGKTLIPDLLASSLSSHPLTSNTSTVLTVTSGDPSTTTSANKLWTLSDYQNYYDNIVIDGQNIDAPYLRATETLTIRGASNLRTVVMDAPTISIEGASIVTTLDPTITNVFKVEVTGTDLTIASGAKLHADAKGYLGGVSGTNSSIIGRTNGNTTTGGSAGGSYASGGSHGGYGGRGNNSELPASPYGVIDAPVLPGGGGSTQTASSYAGGNGGGVIRISLSGTLTIENLISANGGNHTSNSSGGGAGGSIWITANTIATSASGLRVTANGGNGGASTNGSGGGGRIALEYSSLSTFAVSNTFVRATGAAPGNAAMRSHAGTIYSKNGVNLPDLLIDNNGLAIPTNYETQINQALNLQTLTVQGQGIAKQMSVGNAIAVQNDVIVTSPAIMRVPNNGTTNNTGPWTWFTYGTLTGTITEY